MKMAVHTGLAPVWRVEDWLYNLEVIWPSRAKPQLGKTIKNPKAKSRAGSPGSSLHVLSVSFTASGTEQSFLTGLHHHCQAFQLALQHVNRAARLLHSRGGIDGGI